jgi:hypothetical protein
LSKEGYKKQLKQIFRILNSFLDRAFNPELRDENPEEVLIYNPPTVQKPLKKVPYQADFQKLKVCLGLLCILDADVELALSLAARIDIDRIKLVYECVSDSQYLSDLTMRLQHFG